MAGIPHHSGKENTTASAQSSFAWFGPRCPGLNVPSGVGTVARRRSPTQGRSRVLLGIVVAVDHCLPFHRIQIRHAGISWPNSCNTRMPSSCSAPGQRRSLPELPVPTNTFIRGPPRSPCPPTESAAEIGSRQGGRTGSVDPVAIETRCERIWPWARLGCRTAWWCSSARGVIPLEIGIPHRLLRPGPAPPDGTPASTRSSPPPLEIRTGADGTPISRSTSSTAPDVPDHRRHGDLPGCR